MPFLECAGIFLETESVDWEVFAKHPRLYDIAFNTSSKFEPGSDKEIIEALSAYGKRVRKLTRYRVGNGFQIEFEPIKEISYPLPFHAYQINLMYDIKTGGMARPKWPLSV